MFFFILVYRFYVLFSVFFFCFLFFFFIFFFFFVFNDTATTEIYTLSLHDALPICAGLPLSRPDQSGCRAERQSTGGKSVRLWNSWEHSRLHDQRRLHLQTHCRSSWERAARRKHEIGRAHV